MRLTSHSFAHGARIPTEFAFGRRGERGEPCVWADNRNPHLAWDDVPQGTRCFALTCIDGDVPGKPDDVNQAGRTVPVDLPRVDFVHWLMSDIPATCREIGAGACSEGVTARGKRAPHGPAGSRQGRNDYTGWFAGDADMAGDYLGYDGPCPPWNDARLHHYRFTLHALDLPRLELPHAFAWPELARAMQGHVLASAERIGTYSLNPDV